MSEIAKKAIMRIRLAITKALLKGVDDTTAMQLVKLQILDSELPESIERLQSYGLTSNPPLESETVVAEIGGTRDNLVALVIDSAANRIKNLLLGETCFYSMHGQTIKHDENGETLYTASAHKFNDGGRSGARIDDEVKSTTIEDAAFWAWVSAVHSFCGSVGTALGIPFTVPLPSEMTSKITSGSSTVELPND